MKPIKPLTPVQSILLFGSFGLTFRLCVYGILPWLKGLGVMEFWAFMISYSVPLLLMIAGTIVGLAREQNLRYWQTRLRFNRLTAKGVFWCIAIFVVSFLLTGLLTPTAAYIAFHKMLAPPDFMPDILHPGKTIPGQRLTSFMGVSLKGAYWVVVVYFIFLTFFNILGEEVWFRGYILPRQELTWGKYAWYTTVSCGAFFIFRFIRGRYFTCYRPRAR